MFSFISNTKQKATQAIALGAFPQAAGGAGLTQPAAGLIAGDRGCLPTVVANGAADLPQTATTPLRLPLGANANTAAAALTVASDQAAVATLLCATSGQCCITDLCNSMSRIEMSFVAMIMSIALALIGVFKGF